MPTYEYVCKSCGKDLEVVQAFTDDPLTACPTCGGDLKKVFGSVGIVFKGAGFYKTDSRGTSSTATPPASSESKIDSASSTSTESTSTPASTPAPAAAPAPSSSSTSD